MGRPLLGEASSSPLSARSCGSESPWGGEGADGFSLAVRSRRRQLRLRQDELADLAGVSERFVYSLENGKQTVQLDKVIAVLAALGLHLELHRGQAAEIGLKTGVRP